MLTSLPFSDFNPIFFLLLSMILQDNHRESQRGKNIYIMRHRTRICLSWLRIRLAVPSFTISTISWDPSDPMWYPLIYRTVLRNDCVLWRFCLLSMSIGIFLALMYGRWCLKCICFKPENNGDIHIKGTDLPYNSPSLSFSVIVKQKCQNFDNFWLNLHMVYLDIRHRQSSQHINFLSVLGGTRPLQAALSFPPYGILTVFSSLISL